MCANIVLLMCLIFICACGVTVNKEKHEGNLGKILRAYNVEEMKKSILSVHLLPNFLLGSIYEETIYWRSDFRNANVWRSKINWDYLMNQTPLTTKIMEKISVDRDQFLEHDKIMVKHSKDLQITKLEEPRVLETTSLF